MSTAASDARLLDVKVTQRGAERLAKGHVWIYKSDVKSTPRGLENGSAVRVLEPSGRCLGVAHWSEKSQISLRLLSRLEEDPEALLRTRLGLAIALRERLFPGESGVRLVHGEGDLLPGLVVDRYGDALSVQTLTFAMDRRKAWLVDELQELTGAEVVVERNDVATRRHEGLEQAKGVLRGTLRGPVPYREGRVELVADLLEGQKTGAFLDQRENHVLAGTLAAGRALDCFSYFGGFALQLARNATEVVAVDSSEKAVAEIEANAKRNGLRNVSAKCANSFDDLRARVDAGERFDTIVLDPPAFTKSKDTVDAAVRGYKEINLRALQLLNPGGLLVTASCSFHLDEARFEELLVSAAVDAKRSVQLLEKRGAGRDHPVLPGVPETRYLKCFVLRVV